MLTSQGLPSDSTSVLKALPGKLDIKRSESSWYSFYQFTQCFTLQTSDYNIIFDFCVDSASLAMSFKNATSS